eukprot:GGOE01018952.1.p1 GENE.GGOE01018952.1~~GGOE01018952.1.p1  ORF type:complete len:139 (-),score=9.73 GGOE01018952.1:36-452(-)
MYVLQLSVPKKVAFSATGRDLQSRFQEKLKTPTYGPRVEGALADLPKPEAIQTVFSKATRIASTHLDDCIKDSADNLAIFHKLRCFDPCNVKDMNNAWNQTPTNCPPPGAVINMSKGSEFSSGHGSSWLMGMFDVAGV